MKALALCFFLVFATNLKAQNSYSKVLAITTIANASSGTIQLKWSKISSASGYTIARKLRNAAAWTYIDTTATNSDTSFTDIITNRSVGYEYQIITTGSGVQASGCVYAAIDLPANHYTGRLLLLVDSSYINYCSQEIKQYVLDIIKEGWTCRLQFIDRNAPIDHVKSIIKTLYEQDTLNTKGIFILGHIKIPYSGDIYPDGHPDHEGAWPADCVYADTSISRWTDNTINVTSSSRTANKNIPGDGKFDQWSIKLNNIKLFVTRVDLFDMPSINSNDSLLIKNYLIKDHAYRSLQNQFRMRALVDDNFGYFAGEAFGQNGYRNGVNLLGKDSVSDADYFTAMNTLDHSYLWSYGCGNGTYISAGGIGGTNDYQVTNVKSVFTMMFGSYFGDWDNSNNFLRAPLASNSSILTNCWAGRPNWFFHAMGLGECIGLSAYSQVKTPGAYVPTNYGSGFVHTELLGDPTLKMYLYEPARNLILTGTNNTTVNVSWSASTDVSVTGYYVYRSTSMGNRFTLLNPNPVSTLSFIDNTAALGKNFYMIRAVKSQTTVSSGRFYNLSAGIIDSITLSSTLPVQLIDFTLNNKDCNVNLEWKMATEQNVDHYEIMFSTDGFQYSSLGKTKAANKSDYKTIHQQVCTLYPDQILYYKLKITNENGSFLFSNVITTKINNTHHISIMENPVMDDLTIKGLNKPGSIRIVNINGEVLYEQNVHQESVKMNASFLKAGVYVLQYFSGGSALFLKFVKK